MATVRVFPFSIFDPVHLGIDENGEHVTVNLAERNILVGGKPGAGKSSALNLITAHGALSADCKLALIDGKQVELGPWRHCADIFVGPSITDALDAMISLQQTMNNRYDHLLATGRRKITRQSGETVWLVLIDEYAYFSTTVGKNHSVMTSRPWPVTWWHAAAPLGSSSSWPPSGHPTRSSTPRCGTCSPTGLPSAAPPTPPPTWCWGRAGPRKATPRPRSTRWPAASAGCCPKPASPAGSRPPI
jgi:hypothetical protein